MIAGLPGTGIGGIFYLLSVACMPFRELAMLVRGKSSLKRWKMILKYWCMSWGIIIGFWFMGWLLALRIPSRNLKHQTSITAPSHNILHMQPILISLAALLYVLVVVEISRLYIPKPFKK